jgi:alkylation response protein AidB-like acyl-CoA dehydrogenase
MTVATLPAADTSAEALARLTATLASTAEYYDRTAEFPWEPLRAVHEAGLLTLGVGQEYGGRDVTLTELSRVLQAVGKGDPSVALLTAMTIFQHLQQARLHKWPAALYARVLEEASAGPVVLNAIRAEPELGAPARGGLPATRVTRTSAGWLLNGRKAYGTGAEGLAYHMVWAASYDDDPLVGHVIVPGDTPGITVIRTWDHFGLRASSTHDIVYENVEVPFENFPGVPLSQSAPDSYGPQGLAVIALYVGVARAAQEFFLRFANERVPSALGRPIATTERIQSIAGEIESALIAAEEILYGLASRVDAGDEDAARRAGVAKLLITRSITGAVGAAIAAIGNPGLTRNNPLERHYRDIHCSRIHPPQDDTALIAAGRRTLGQYARLQHRGPQVRASSPPVFEPRSATGTGRQKTAILLEQPVLNPC